MEYLRLLLPRAGNLGNLQIVTRPYQLTAWLNHNSGALSGRIREARYIPSIAAVRCGVILGAQYLTDLPGEGGSVPLDVTWGADMPLVLLFTNLSVDTEVTLTIPVDAVGYGSSMARA